MIAVTSAAEMSAHAVWLAGGADATGLVPPVSLVGLRVVVLDRTVVLDVEAVGDALEHAPAINGRTARPSTTNGSLRRRGAVRMGAPYTSRRGVQQRRTD
jgi:hypothetical protein